MAPREAAGARRPAQRETLELEIQVAGARRFFDSGSSRRPRRRGPVLGLIGTALDLTERRRDEQQHAADDARAHPPLEEPARGDPGDGAQDREHCSATSTASSADFSARLRAMAAAQDLLVSQSWHGRRPRGADPRHARPDVAPDASRSASPARRSCSRPTRRRTSASPSTSSTTNASKLRRALGRRRPSSRSSGRTWTARCGSAGSERRWPAGRRAADRSGFGRILLERLVGTTLTARSRSTSAAGPGLPDRVPRLRPDRRLTPRRQSLRASSRSPRSAARARAPAPRAPPPRARSRARSPSPRADSHAVAGKLPRRAVAREPRHSRRRNRPRGRACGRARSS